MPFRAIGIDPSTSATGIVVLDEQDATSPALVHHEEISLPEFEGIERYRRIVLRIMTVIHEYKPDRIVVEGYSLNLKNKSSVVPLVELGGILRLMLVLDKLTWLDPRASAVKEFVTGKGNSAKELVMMNTFKRWQYEAATNNMADAYVLAVMGLAHANRLRGATAGQRKIVGGLKIMSK